MPLMYTSRSRSSDRFSATKDSLMCSSSLYWVLISDCSEASRARWAVRDSPRPPDRQERITAS